MDVDPRLIELVALLRAAGVDVEGGDNRLHFPSGLTWKDMQLLRAALPLAGGHHPKRAGLPR